MQTHLSIIVFVITIADLEIKYCPKFYKTDFSNEHFENKILSTYVKKCLKS